MAQIILKISKRQTLEIIQVYLPTSSHTDEEVDTVYEDIDRLLDEDKAKHTIVMGDFNAKVGQQKDDSERMIRKFGIGTSTICLNNSFKIMNTIFKKKEHRRWT